MALSSTPAATVTTVAFSKLQAPDAINARPDTKDGLDELAASIAARGLIQPIAVRPADGADKFDVIDGRRRFKAIQRLVKDKSWPKTTMIPVIIRNETDAEALETSLAANTVRLPMHAVDQHAVFARLADQGVPVADIAARFGIGERQVRQQMALGALAPQVRDAWRKGTIDAEAAKAFAGSGADHERQAEALARLRKQGSWALTSHSVKNALRAGRVSAARIDRSLLQAYLESGGSLSEDLFDEARYVDDPVLLASVKRAVLGTTLESLRGEGWGWVALEADLPSGWPGGWTHWDELPRWSDLKLAGPLTDAQRAEWEAIRARIDGAEGDEEFEAASAEFEVWSAARDLDGWPMELRATAGAVIDDDGEVHRGIVRPEDAAGTGGEDASEEAPDDEDEDNESDVQATGDNAADDAGASDDPYATSAALTQELTAARTRAAANTLRVTPDVALRMVVAALSVSRWESRLKIAAEPFGGQRGVGREAEGDFAEIVLDLLGKDDGAVLGRLAGLACATLDLQETRYRQDDPHEAVVGFLPGSIYLQEMRGVFDPEDYFKRATKAAALAAIEEMREAGHGAGLAPDDALADMRKLDLAGVAAERAAACGWLPPCLRHPAYSIEAATAEVAA